MKKWMNIIGTLVVLAAGFLIIVPMINNCGNKLYKRSLKKENIDFDAEGPEIIKKENIESNEGK